MAGCTVPREPRSSDLGAKCHLSRQQSTNLLYKPQEPAWATLRRVDPEHRVCALSRVSWTRASTSSRRERGPLGQRRRPAPQAAPLNCHLCSVSNSTRERYFRAKTPRKDTRAGPRGPGRRHADRPGQASAHRSSGANATRSCGLGFSPARGRPTRAHVEPSEPSGRGGRPPDGPGPGGLLRSRQPVGTSTREA